MATLLKQQLLQLGSFQQGSVPSKGLKQDSLIFIDSEAGEVTLERVYEQCIKGVESLQVLDGRFGAFKQTLFGRSGLKTFRERLTAEELKQLNFAISQFLRLLSDYFVTEEAWIILEYLIRKYRVHEQHEDALMACALPYHHNIKFVRVVQTMQLRDQWRFLEPLQTSGASLSLEVLVQRCVKDRGLLRFVCQAAQNYASMDAVGQNFITLYLQIVKSILKINSQDGSMVQFIFAYVVSGLRSGNGEYLCASLVLVSELSSGISLGDKLLESLCQEIMHHCYMKFPKAAIMTLQSIAFNQCFPNTCAKLLCTQDLLLNIQKLAFVNCQQLLRNIFYISLEGLLSGVTTASFLHQILQQLNMQQQDLDDAVVKICGYSMENMNNEVYTFLSEMQRQYVEMLTSAISTLLPAQVKILSKILNETNSCLMDGEFTLEQALNSKQIENRKKVVNKLCSILENRCIQEDMKQLVYKLVLKRLCVEEDPNLVVNMLLLMKSKGLSAYTGQQLLQKFVEDQSVVSGVIQCAVQQQSDDNAGVVLEGLAIQVLNKHEKVEVDLCGWLFGKIGSKMQIDDLVTGLSSGLRENFWKHEQKLLSILDCTGQYGYCLLMLAVLHSLMQHDTPEYSIALATALLSSNKATSRLLHTAAASSPKLQSEIISKEGFPLQDDFFSYTLLQRNGSVSLRVLAACLDRSSGDCVQWGRLWFERINELPLSRKQCDFAVVLTSLATTMQDGVQLCLLLLVNAKTEDELCNCLKMLNALPNKHFNKEQNVSMVAALFMQLCKQWSQHSRKMMLKYLPKIKISHDSDFQTCLKSMKSRQDELVQSTAAIRRFIQQSSDIVLKGCFLNLMQQEEQVSEVQAILLIWLLEQKCAVPQQLVLKKIKQIGYSVELGHIGVELISLLLPNLETPSLVECQELPLIMSSPQVRSVYYELLGQCNNEDSVCVLFKKYSQEMDAGASKVLVNSLRVQLGQNAKFVAKILKSEESDDIVAVLQVLQQSIVACNAQKTLVAHLLNKLHFNTERKLDERLNYVNGLVLSLILQFAVNVMDNFRVQHIKLICQCCQVQQNCEVALQIIQVVAQYGNKKLTTECFSDIFNVILQSCQLNCSEKNIQKTLLSIKKIFDDSKKMWCRVLYILQNVESQQQRILIVKSLGDDMHDTFLGIFTLLTQPHDTAWQLVLAEQLLLQCSVGGQLYVFVQLLKCNTRIGLNEYELLVQFVSNNLQGAEGRMKHVVNKSEMQEQAIQLLQTALNISSTFKNKQVYIDSICSAVARLLPLQLYLNSLMQDAVVATTSLRYFRMALTKGIMDDGLTTDAISCFCKQLIDQLYVDTATAVCRCDIVYILTDLVLFGEGQYLINSMESMIGMLSERCDGDVISACLCCLQRLISSFGKKLIPIASNLFQSLISIADTQLDICIRRLAVSTLCIGIEQLSAFLVPHLDKFLNIIIMPEFAEDNKVFDAIAQCIPPRTMLPIIILQWEKCNSVGKRGLMKLTCGMSAQFSPKLALQNMQQMLQIIQYSWLESGEVVDISVQCFKHVVLRLGESSFKQLFLHLLQWAKDAGSLGMSSFLQACCELCNSLKIILLPYRTYILECCIQQLKGKDRVEQAVKCMQSCFTNVGEIDIEMEAVWKECFTLVLDTYTCTHATYAHLMDCCIRLVQLSKNFGWWPTILQQVYKRIFDGSSMVQVQYLQIVQGCIEVLGEVFDGYIEENISQLLQIQENADEEVSNLCKDILLVLEKKQKAMAC